MIAWGGMYSYAPWVLGGTPLCVCVLMETDDFVL